MAQWREDGPGAARTGRFGDKQPNVLALHINASKGTGWRHEGGGLMRHQYLVRTSGLHAVPDGVWVHASVTGKSTHRGGTSISVHTERHTVRTSA